MIVSYSPELNEFLFPLGAAPPLLPLAFWLPGGALPPLFPLAFLFPLGAPERKGALLFNLGALPLNLSSHLSFAFHLRTVLLVTPNSSAMSLSKRAPSLSFQRRKSPSLLGSRGLTITYHPPPSC